MIKSIKAMKNGLARGATLAAVLMTGVLAFGAGAVSAQDRNVGMPEDKGIWLPEMVTEQGQQMADFHVLLLWVITIITVFVALLMAYTMIRFRAKANPEPSKVSHNTPLEIFWTIVPVFILIGIGAKSFPLLYFQEVIPETEFAVKVTGKQWYWTYSYPDHDDIEFDSIMVDGAAFSGTSEGNAIRAKAEDDLTTFLGMPAKLNARLLDADTRLVVPVDTKIKVLITANKVLHAFTVPRFGIKMDAVPGRVNETWFEANTVGTYYGQCSELCGQNHAFMPIAVEVVTKEEFARWLETAKAAGYANAPAVSAFGR